MLSVCSCLVKMSYTAMYLTVMKANIIDLVVW